MILVDANVVVHALTVSNYSERARQIFQPYTVVTAPDILFGEVANVLGKLARTKQISNQQAELCFHTVQNMPLRFIRSNAVTRNAFALSLEYNQGFFDCIYVEIARENQLPLITLDNKLIQKFLAYYRNIIHLSDWTP